jgi:hypothetical protein
MCWVIINCLTSCFSSNPSSWSGGESNAKVYVSGPAKSIQQFDQALKRYSSPVPLRLYFD